MPQKPNRKDMQPYVASGEHGGEYTDYKAGTPYSKGYKPKKKENVAIEDDPNKAKPSREYEGSVSKYIDTHSDYDEVDKKNLNDILTKGDEQYNKIIDNVLKNGNGRYQYKKTNKNSYFHPYWGEIVFDNKAIQGEENSGYAKGDTFYHENGHMVDFSNRSGAYSNTFVSPKHGTTLLDMLVKEGAMFKRNNLQEELIKEEQTLRNKYKKEYSGLSDREWQEYQNANKVVSDSYDINNDQIKEEINNAVNLWINGEITREESLNKVNDIRTKYSKMREESVKKEQAIVDKYSKMVIEADYRARNKMYETYNSIEDMVDAIYKGHSKMSYGHGPSYWTRDRRNRGYEFFAECFSANANNPKAKEVIKRYFPKSYEIFEEIIEEIK